MINGKIERSEKQVYYSLPFGAMILVDAGRCYANDPLAQYDKQGPKSGDEPPEVVCHISQRVQGR